MSRVAGHKVTYRTSGGVQAGAFLVGARTIAECACGWHTEEPLRDWARTAYARHLASVRTKPRANPDDYERWASASREASRAIRWRRAPDGGWEYGPWRLTPIRAPMFGPGGMFGVVGWDVSREGASVARKGKLFVARAYVARKIESERG